MVGLTNITPRFAWIADHKADRPLFDVSVMETSRFVVLPSLGSIVEGWLLVIPRRRMPNLSFLNSSEASELANLVQVLRQRLGGFSGEVFEFEHGGKYGSKLSCGVEQAHLHIVPLPFDLIKSARRIDGVIWHESKNHFGSDHQGGVREYLWARPQDGSSITGFIDHPVSQWFRRLIARELGRDAEWDYKLVPNVVNMNRTVAALGSRDDRRL